MKFSVWICALLLVVIGTTRSQDFDLGDALDDDGPTKPPANEPKNPQKPPSGDGFDLSDALGPDADPVPEKPKKPAVPAEDDGILDVLNFGNKDPTKPPKKAGGDDFGFDLSDALGPDPNPKPNKPVKPNMGGGGGSFDDSDLADVGKGGYKPDGGGGYNQDHDSYGGGDGGGGGGGRGADQPQEAGGGQIAGIASAIGVALMGAAGSYFAYQKKKLCFKLQGGADPESGKNHQGNNSQPQLLSNLLRSS